MIFESIYGDIVKSFGTLWDFKERGGSLEVITPFATTSHKFVSVFVTKRGDDFIVSDGGWVADGTYDSSFDRDIDCYGKVVSHCQNSFDIKETYGQFGTSIFYKKTHKEIAVPSLVLDMANFVSMLVSLSGVEYEKERKMYDLFSRSANEYLSKVFVGRFETNVFFDRTTRHVKPSAIIKKENGKVLLLNYITGSNISNFQSSIGKTTVIFELAEKSVDLIRDTIENKVIFIDDLAQGYDANRVTPWLDNLTEKPRIKRVDWSHKEEILEL